MKDRQELVEQLDWLERQQMQLMDLMYKEPDDPSRTMFHMETIMEDLQKINEKIEILNLILNDDRE